MGGEPAHFLTNRYKEFFGGAISWRKGSEGSWGKKSDRVVEMEKSQHFRFIDLGSKRICDRALGRNYGRR